MGAEPGRRFLKQPAEKLKVVFVAAQFVMRKWPRGHDFARALALI